MREDSEEQSFQETESIVTLLSRRSLRRARSNNRMGHRATRNGAPRPNADDILRETLTDLKCVEEDDSSRIRALDWLERILARWSCDCASKTTSTAAAAASTSDKSHDDLGSPSKKKARAPPPPMVNSWQRPRPVLITFGSYRLGVHRPSSDLDLLVLAPSHCTREDFFGSLVTLLQKQPSTAVQHVHPIPTAYTPVIKFTLFGLSVDLLFARGSSFKILQYQQKRPNPLLVTAANSSGDHRSDEYVIDDTDLLDQDEAGVRSLNGARVSQMILEAVPNLKTFRTVLTAVKQWAIAKGVYSNVLGFLGGINYAIMVAYVCIHNPMISHSPVALLERFFHTFAAWKWPEPVMIGALQAERPSSCILDLAAWNPMVNRRDRLHIMPIITPAYPSMNSAYNVDTPQLRRMTHELTLAANWMTICTSRHACFYHLFRPSDFFLSHHHFLQVTITSATHQEHVEWLRLVESRLRKLIGSLDTPEIQAWPFAKLFHKPRETEASLENDSSDANESNKKDEEHESSFYIALRFAPGTTSFDLRGLTSDFVHQVNGWKKRTAGMDMSLAPILAMNLPSYVVPPLKLPDDAETASNSSWASSTDDLEDDDAHDGTTDAPDAEEDRQAPSQDQGSQKDTTAPTESLVSLLVGHSSSA